MNNESAVLQVISEGLDDWVPIDRVVDLARDLAGDSGGDFREFAQAMISELIVGGLMIPGVIGDEGFQAWDAADSTISMGKIIQQLDQVGWLPRGDVCWLSNTDEGDRIARSR